jgi:hypothetical protein
LDRLITERKSKMTVDGKPVDHFKKGARVKLTWPTASASDRQGSRLIVNNVE